MFLLIGIAVGMMSMGSPRAACACVHRAAYQFGVKMGDGRKKDLKKNSKKSKEAKINQELQKINNLMNKRKPGGQ
jgi:hypothetical protein